MDRGAGKVLALAAEGIPRQVNETQGAVHLVFRLGLRAQIAEASGSDDLRLQPLGKFRRPVLRHPEEIDHVIIDVVQDFPTARLFRKEQLGRTGEHFHVQLVYRHQLQQHVLEIFLSAWPSEG